MLYYPDLNLWLDAVDASTRSVHAVHEDGEMPTATTPQIQVRVVYRRQQLANVHLPCHGYKRTGNKGDY